LLPKVHSATQNQTQFGNIELFLY